MLLAQVAAVGPPHMTTGFLSRKAHKLVVRGHLPMPPDNFLAGTLMRIHSIFWCICIYFDITTPINSNYLLPFGRDLKGVKRVLAGWDLHQSTAHPRLPNTSEYEALLYLSPFGRNSNVKLCPPIRPLPPFGRLRTTSFENSTNRNVVPTFLFDFYFHYRPILHGPGFKSYYLTYIHEDCILSCTVLPQYTTRQTD